MSINRIALIDVQGQLATIAPDGHDARVLSDGSRWFQFPAWSPIGAQLAAIGGARGRDGGGSAGIWLFDDAAPVTGSQAMHDNRAYPPIYVYWSPDGRCLSFLAADPALDTMGLFLASRDHGATPVRVTRGRPCFWQWSPDSRNILLHSGVVGDDARLNYYEVDEGQTRVVQNKIAVPGLFQSPGISSSGKYWSFGDLDQEGVLRVVIDGGRNHGQRVAEHVGVAAMAWNPIRDQLAFISPAEQAQHCYGEIRVVDADSGTARVIVDRTVVAFFWSPDGRRIAYLAPANAPRSYAELLGRDEPDSMGGRYRSGSLEKLLRSEPDEAGRPLRLALWVVDVETDNRNLLGTFEPNKLFINQFLPFFDQYALSHRIWSPTSDAIVLPVVKRDADGRENYRVVVFDVATRKQRDLAEGVSAFWSWL